MYWGLKLRGVRVKFDKRHRIFIHVGDAARLAGVVYHSTNVRWRDIYVYFRRAGVYIPQDERHCVWLSPEKLTAGLAQIGCNHHRRYQERHRRRQQVIAWIWGFLVPASEMMWYGYLLGARLGAIREFIDAVMEARPGLFPRLGREARKMYEEAKG